MATTQKALDLAGFLQEALNIRLTALAVPITVGAVTFDTDSNPLIQIGTGVAGAKGGIVKVLPTPWPLAKDVLGNAAIQYTPHTIQVATESGAAAGTDINDPSVLMPVLAEILARGCRTEWYKTANGVAPVVASLIAANLKAAFDSLYYPLVSSQ